MSDKVTLEQKAIQVCRLLVTAYAKGHLNGGSIDWNDLDLAHEAALLVYREAKKTQRGKTDFVKLSMLKDKDIDLSDILEQDFSKAKVRKPKKKGK